MRRARHSAVPLSIYGVAFAIALCASAALALPTKAEAAIHLGSPNTVSLTNGLVGYWPLDVFVTDWNTNTTADISGTGNNLRLTSLATSTAPAVGRIGGALKFNGTSSYLSNSSVSGLPAANAPQTLAELPAQLKTPAEEAAQRRVTYVG